MQFPRAYETKMLMATLNSLAELTLWLKMPLERIFLECTKATRAFGLRRPTRTRIPESRVIQNVSLQVLLFSLIYELSPKSFDKLEITSLDHLLSYS